MHEYFKISIIKNEESILENLFCFKFNNKYLLDSVTTYYVDLFMICSNIYNLSIKRYFFKYNF